MISASDARALSETPDHILLSIVEASTAGYIGASVYLYRYENFQDTITELRTLGYTVTVDDNKMGAVRLLITW